MSKHFTKILAIVMVLATLVTMFAVPASAAGSYPMTCYIYYKNESGATVAITKTFSMNAADTSAQQTKYYSPTVSGYALKNSSDSYVTYAMMDKSFPASHYVRNGTATYTVYYTEFVERHIIPRFGEIELDEPTAFDIQRYVTHLCTNGNLKTRKESVPNSVNTIITVVQNSFKWHILSCEAFADGCYIFAFAIVQILLPK